MNLNQVNLAGRLSRVPQLKYLPSQTALAEFGVVCNRKFKSAQGEERDEATFVDVSAFGRVAEAINTHMRKGREIFIQGRLKFDSWEDKQSGQKRSKLSVVAESFQFVGPKPADGGSENRPSPSPRQGTGAVGRSAEKGEQPFGEEEQFKDEDIPF